MLLTISTTHRPATDIGYLLGKHPDRCQTFQFPWANAHVFYPEASEERCTIALAVDLLTHKLTPQNRGTAHSRQEHYVNDRPYAATSHLALIMNQLFSQAAAAHNKEKPELSLTPIPLTAWLPTVPRGNRTNLVEDLFEPLGYAVTATPLPIDPERPQSGTTRHVELTLENTITLSELLKHLYVLLPTLDGGKHHFVDQSEIDKLMRFGDGWLPTHPLKELITASAVNQRVSMANRALALMAAQNSAETEPENSQQGQEARHEKQETAIEKGIGLGRMRQHAVLEEVKKANPSSVLDLGCGEGRLTLDLVKLPRLAKVTAMDVSTRAMAHLSRRADRLNPAQKDKLTLLHGSLAYRDPRLNGHDLAVAMEVIEHIDEEKLPSFEDAVLAGAKPKTLVVTTPNVEYNKVFQMPEGSSRHRDHRFEWDRDTFAQWARKTAQKHGYAVSITGIGPTDPQAGEPTQMAVFTANNAQNQPPPPPRDNPASVYH